MKNANSQQNVTILVLGTGGTIAGISTSSMNASQPKRDMAYKSAVLPIYSLVPASKHIIITEQIAQIDSKDMSFDVWEKLHTRISAAQNDTSIDAIVITHGTDTLEETAYFLHRTIACTKPVILTGAMRPADAMDSDGSQNMAFALEQAALLGAGVWVTFAGKVFSGGNVQKIHPTRLDAFDEINKSDGFQSHKPLILFNPPIKRWPRVEIVMSYAGASGALVEALIAQKVDGIVVAGTGNNTVHDALQASLDKAPEAGIAVALSTRCLQGGGMLTPVQARIELILQLMQSV